MATPTGTRCISFRLNDHEGVWVYSNTKGIQLQIRKTVPTEQDITTPSFKVAVSLTPADALKLAGELLTAAGTILKMNPGELPGTSVAGRNSRSDTRRLSDSSGFADLFRCGRRGRCCRCRWR